MQVRSSKAHAQRQQLCSDLLCFCHVCNTLPLLAADTFLQGRRRKNTARQNTTQAATCCSNARKRLSSHRPKNPCAHNLAHSLPLAPAPPFHSDISPPTGRDHHGAAEKTCVLPSHLHMYTLLTPSRRAPGAQLSSLGWRAEYVAPRIHHHHPRYLSLTYRRCL